MCGVSEAWPGDITVMTSVICENRQTMTRTRGNTWPRHNIFTRSPNTVLSVAPAAGYGVGRRARLAGRLAGPPGPVISPSNTVP